MTARLVGGIAAAALAVGILVGAAGAVVVRGPSTPDLADHMAQMSGMMAMMGGSSMMGSDSSMMGSGSTSDAGATVSPEDHAAHHGLPNPSPVR